MSDTSDYIEDPDQWQESVTSILLDAAGRIDAISTPPGDERWFPNRCLMLSERMTDNGRLVISGFHTGLPISDQMGMAHALTVKLDHDLLADDDA